ncbi:GNAT family N-acetyltransferase [Xanthomonas melonis]|uniref:GNAT family N-acetyltransferase n=1 Tax=Xanthomonas melonis TaxID=56456 RepID=UPI001E59EE5D|nr:GNAT family N-acetyltransferase [Xanthomonas melonis]MCD0247104.1 N-acetyltransferase [Xanthomonas melonis]
MRAEHQPAEQRFHLSADGQRTELQYRRDDARLTITHTVVPDAIAGRGIASALVEAALQYARDSGLKVVPACSYAEAYMRRHHQYHDLLA